MTSIRKIYKDKEMSTRDHSKDKKRSDNISEDKISNEVGDGSSSLVKTLTAPIGLSLKEEKQTKPYYGK